MWRAKGPAMPLSSPCSWQKASAASCITDTPLKRNHECVVPVWYKEVAGRNGPAAEVQSLCRVCNCSAVGALLTEVKPAHHLPSSPCHHIPGDDPICSCSTWGLSPSLSWIWSVRPSPMSTVVMSMICLLLLSCLRATPESPANRSQTMGLL